MSKKRATRTDKLIAAVAERFRHLSYVDGSFIHEHKVSSGEIDFLFTVADILEGVLALPYEYQLIIRCMGGKDAMPPDAGLYALVNLYRQQVASEAVTRIDGLSAELLKGTSFEKK